MATGMDIGRIITDTEVARMYQRAGSFNIRYFTASMAQAYAELAEGNGEAARRPVDAVLQEFKRMPTNHDLRVIYESLVDTLVAQYTTTLCAPFLPQSKRVHTSLQS